MLLDLRPLLDSQTASTSTGSTGAPVVAGGHSNDDMYTVYYRQQALAAAAALAADEEALLALYASDDIDGKTLLRELKKLN